MTDWKWIRERDNLQKEGQWVCDFCLGPDPVCSFPAPAMRLDRYEAKDDGWCSCEPCAQLLESGMLEELRIRINEGHRKRFGHGWQLEVRIQRAVLKSILPKRFGLHDDVTWSKLVFEGQNRTRGIN